MTPLIDFENLNATSESQPTSDRWQRDSTGTYEIQYDKKGRLLNRIANQLVRIIQILFVIVGRKINIEYWVEFADAYNNVKVRIRHEDLSDEKAFLRSAPAGFSFRACFGIFNLFRECVMSDLSHATRTAVLTTLGWYIWKGETIFAHAGGICSASPYFKKADPTDNGTAELLDLIDIDVECSEFPIMAGQHKPISDVLVEVPPQFAKYKLPKPNSKEDAFNAIRRVIELLSCDIPAIYIGVAAVLATVIRDPRYALFLYGETGSLKTAFALILLRFFAPNAGEADCVSFTSTANAIRAYFAVSGNVPVVIDDFVPGNGYRQSSEEVKKTEDIIRPVVNGTGKDRCGSDGQLRSSPRPRGLAILTGEELPDGCESLKWRTINVPVEKSTFAPLTNGDRPNRFDSFQKCAARGDFAMATYVFVEYLAGGLNIARTQLGGSSTDSKLQTHRRSADSTNELLSGMANFLYMTMKLKACSEEEADEIYDRTSSAIHANQQRAVLESLEDSPVEKFLMLLRECLQAKKCHIESERPDLHNEVDNFVPLKLLGYSEHKVEKDQELAADESNEEPVAPEYQTIYKPHGKTIGFVDRFNTLDLIPSVALEAANNLAKNCGMNPLPSAKVMGKMLAAKGYLHKQSNDRNTYKIRCGSVTNDVWRMEIRHLFEAVIDASEFEVGCLKDLNEEDRIAKVRSFTEEARAKLLPRFAQRFEAILNPFLEQTDRAALLTPPPLPAASHEHSRWKPQAINPPHVPGWSKPRGPDELEA